jgi:hypothetical protein
METKLAAEQPPETSTEAGGDPVAEQVRITNMVAHGSMRGQIGPDPDVAAKLASAAAGEAVPMTEAAMKRAMETTTFYGATPRQTALSAVQVAAIQSAEAAYAAAERRVKEGGGTEDDAAASIQAMVPLTILLNARHHEYLATRASIFGETPSAHLERILREFRSYFDDKRPELAQIEAQRNGGAVTRRMS